ncbi:MAG: S53 family peptidase [Terracidiphilus sp.]|nr:S53 family peptidase [Terracidiphilus sp.]
MTVPNLVTKPVDTGLVSPLVQNHPAWAVAANQISQVPDDQDLEQLTLVLARTTARQQAFEQLLADQQNPSSPNYHKWLTAAEIGTRFGVSDSDLAAISTWLAAQGLHVNFISPDRAQIGFGGTAANVNHAFGSTLAYYNVRGQKRLSVSSDPSVPQALSPVIKSVRGLFAVGERPFHTSSELISASPDMTTTSNGTEYHYLTPADFAAIYDVPSSYTGAGITIGIVSWSRVSTADLDAFRAKTSTTFPNPREVIPTAYGGADPGAAYTSVPSSSSVDLGGQQEATLDVIRAGGTAPGASLLLVASTATTASNDGIGADTQYLVYNNAANIVSISFGACESAAGASNVNFWDSLFQTAAGQGISVFVSSGDSAAAGCDDAFAIPGKVVANSPNYICSSQYATCVGGTQFADTTDPAAYWSSSNNSTTFKSALSYIPEGAWNESSTSGIAGSGGGVSTVIATPTWQTGAGVPALRAGRYTPDVSFSAAAHDGYFACMASVGNSSANAGCTGSSWHFLYFSGTSAAAPGMAGVAALLDQKLGGGQGNLNPKLYALASSAPSAFHDTTVSSSGVGSCSTLPSICNSSIYYTSTGAVQPGFLLTTGYDEVTGLGSLDVANFLTAYNTSTTTAPTVTVTPGSSSITTIQPLSVTVKVSGSGSTPTGTVTVSSGSYASAAVTLSSGSASFTIPAGSLVSGSATITASYVPDSASSATYSSATGATTTAISVAKSTPAVTVTPGSSSVTTAQALSVTVAVSAGAGTATATGTVTLASGSYTSAAATLSSGSATISIPAGSLATGTPTLTATYTPDTAGATIYNSNSATATVAVSKSTPGVSINPNYYSIVPGQALAVTVTVSAGTASPSGSVVLSSGSYTSAAATLSSGSATITIPANTFSVGAPTLTAAYTPDTTGATLYNTASRTTTLTVAKITPSVTALASPSSITTAQSTTIAVTVAGNAGNPTPAGSVVLSSGSYTSAAAALSSGSVSIIIPAGTLSLGSNTVTAAYTPDSSSSSSFNTNSGSVPVTVAVNPYFTISGSTITVSKGSSGTATITVTPFSGFTGAVALTASITASPTGAQYKPTFSFSNSTVTIAGTGAVTSTLTATAASTTAALHVPASPANHWKTATGLALASLLLFIAPVKLRRWRNWIGSLALLFALAGVLVACGGSGGGGTTTTKTTPAVTVSPAASSITNQQSLAVTTTVGGAPSGSIVLSGGGYTSSATTLASGSAAITIPAGSLSIGSDTLTAAYTPDTTAAASYNSASGSSTVTVQGISTTGTYTVTITGASGSTTASTTLSLVVQ